MSGSAVDPRAEPESEGGSPPLEALEQVLGHRFANQELLETAVRHSSYAHETRTGESNERLEFLGDAVLEIAVAELLYRAHPEWAEGDLTRGLARLVDRKSLAQLGRALGVGEHLRLGRTELRSAGHTKDGLLADAVEALLGAMYLDAGLSPVFALLRSQFAEALEPGAPAVRRDPKTELQERLMAQQRALPRYVVTDNEVDGDEERFTAEVEIDGESVGRAQGRSKRVAERRAARRALAALETLEGGAGARGATDG